MLCAWLALGLWAAPGALALSVSPSSVTFQAVQGSTNPAAQTVTVSRSNTKQTGWTVSESAGWLAVSPGSGTMTKSAQLTVSVNTAGLGAGTYTATVTVQLNKGGTTSIPVTLTVAPTTAGSGGGTSSTPTTATLSWLPVTSTNLAGYKVYMGTAPGVYGQSFSVGNVTSYVVNGLSIGNTYYFAVTAYNGSGVESGYSNVVSKSIY
jgi:hypothetical protein